jgi:hypothetical protein
VPATRAGERRRRTTAVRSRFGHGPATTSPGCFAQSAAGATAEPRAPSVRRCSWGAGATSATCTRVSPPTGSGAPGRAAEAAARGAPAGLAGVTRARGARTPSHRRAPPDSGRAPPDGGRAPPDSGRAPPDRGRAPPLRRRGHGPHARPSLRGPLEAHTDPALPARLPQRPRAVATRPPPRAPLRAPPRAHCGALPRPVGADARHPPRTRTRRRRTGQLGAPPRPWRAGWSDSAP